MGKSIATKLPVGLGFRFPPRGGELSKGILPPKCPTKIRFRNDKDRPGFDQLPRLKPLKGLGGE